MQFALCNEVLQPLPFQQQCVWAAALGYDALEVAPFTLADDPLSIGDAQARQWRRIAEDAGIAISGLHWLLVAPAGLSIVGADAAVRTRTVAVMERLVELCALLGGRYLVHGSPKQRTPGPGDSAAAVRERALECFARAARRAEGCGVTYCIEPLAPRETPFINTVAEAAALVDAIGSPALK
ncbi:MAG TPA: sugar phosphate isomerase/epimerase family protein, partial [Burkholderiaceae bacterium]|nr:sugar phosphate isomerase/epimerase family protein [Burkholderiaceae bacterium]